ncbi:MAG: hypothetical protein ABL974_05585 [Prosthecobacter sp.]
MMVGDSAVTRTDRFGNRTVVPDAVKVLYSDAANIGFAVWGRANIGNNRLDYWLSDFIQNSLTSADSVMSAGQKLARELNSALNLQGSDWERHVKGIHVSGFESDTPVLYHVHCGTEKESPHELQLYTDFPQNQGLSLTAFNSMLEQGRSGHLRNGYHHHFGMLFEAIQPFTAGLRHVLGTEFPHPSLHGRLKYHELLVKTVAGVLEAANEHPGVNSQLSTIAFTKSGLIHDGRIQFPVGPTSEFASFDLRF